MSTHVLGVKIDSTTRDLARERVDELLDDRKFSTIWTPNPEMIIAAQKSPLFKKVLNSGSLNICDGSGISILSGKRISRIHGSDFILDVCKIATDRGERVFLLGSGEDTVLKKTRAVLKKKFPSLQIVGSHAGPKVRIDKKSGEVVVDRSENDAVLQDIIQCKPSILLVGFGHVKQELWVDRYCGKLPSVLLAMGVGGSFDILSGKNPRAPKTIRAMHLEWLWRLLREPRRLKRMWTAVVIFPILFILKSDAYVTDK